jgi:nitrogen-specific signal transduction histidine kinase
MMDSGVPRFTAENSFLGLIGNCVDITDHKLFEEIRAEMEHVGRLNIAGEMASSLAHELSQPLSAANNYLDACLRRLEGENWDKEGLHKSIRQAYVQTERAGAMINHLKNLVRKQKQECSMLEVNALIKDTVGFLDYELQHHYVQLALELDALPPVLANRVELEQVLINLIKNAIDAMEAAPLRKLRITTRRFARLVDRRALAHRRRARSLSPPAADIVVLGFAGRHDSAGNSTGARLVHIDPGAVPQRQWRTSDRGGFRSARRHAGAT